MAFSLCAGKERATEREATTSKNEFFGKERSVVSGKKAVGSTFIRR